MAKKTIAEITQEGKDSDLISSLKELLGEIPNFHLRTLIGDEQKYSAIMGKLIKFCKKSGNEYTFVGTEKQCAAIIKELGLKGYYKYFTARPENKDVIRIAKETFGLTLGIDNVKQTGTSDYPIPQEIQSTIPRASDL